MNPYLLRILIVLGAIFFVAILMRSFNEPWWMIPAGVIVFAPYGYLFIAEPPLWPWLAVAGAWQVVSLAFVSVVAS